MKLLTLTEAAKEFGLASASSLRTEARKGNLDLVRVAGRDYVTGEAVGRMIDKCRIQGSQQGSGSGNAKVGRPSGLSLADRKKQAQAALSTITQELKKPSRGGSLKTSGPTRHNVISIKSQ